ncbi:MAG: hypothetical protein JSR73_19615 [Proteobacteria bacterium]|nr:hypothetical protein [Pseudomonadota bacterium]
MSQSADTLSILTAALVGLVATLGVAGLVQGAPHLPAPFAAAAAALGLGPVAAPAPACRVGLRLPRESA